MSTTPISSQSGSTTQTTTSTQNSIPANPNGQLGENSFLQMMVTQMQYQDPLDSSGSADSTQMLSQLAQYSQIEALTNLEQTDQSIQTTLQTLTQELGMNMSAQMLGKTVTVTDTNGQTVTGVVSGVSNSNGTPQIEIGDTSYPAANVTQIG